MKKIFFILLINLTLAAEVQHPEITTFGLLKDKCYACERIYTLRNRMSYLNKYRINALNGIQNWLNRQPPSKVTRDIQVYLNQMQDYSDKIVTQLAHDPKIIFYLESIGKIIQDVDPLLPDKIKFDFKNFYETMREIFDIDNDLETLAVPDYYQRWLAKRLELRPYKYLL